MWLATCDEAGLLTEELIARGCLECRSRRRILLLFAGQRFFIRCFFNGIMAAPVVCSVTPMVVATEEAVQPVRSGNREISTPDVRISELRIVVLSSLNLD